MAIEDTGLLNSAITTRDSTLVKNEGKTDVEKTTAGIVTEEESFNQRDAYQLNKEGYNDIEIAEYHNTSAIFPETVAFSEIKNDLEAGGVSNEEASGSNIEEVKDNILNHDVEKYKEYVKNITAENEEHWRTKRICEFH